MLKRVLSSFVGLLFVGSVHAVPFVAEPDAFPAGTDLTNAFPGVTLLIEGDFGPVRSQNAAPFGVASTGTRVFAQNTDVTIASNGEVLRANFASLIQQVSLDLIGNDADDPAFLRAFDSGGALLEEVLRPGAFGANVPFTATITRPTADIAFIRAAGLGDASSLLDFLRFDTGALRVPEPGTLPMLIVALGGLGLSMRRRKG